METIKTKIHAYHFDLRKPAERSQWEELKTRLSETHPRCMESHGGASHWLKEFDGLEIALDTEFLFDNQWNGTPAGSGKGYRVFDWALDYRPNGSPYIKRGHYLEQTPAMAEVRRNIHKCGYCGAHEPAAKGYVFCPHCIGSEYLTEDSLNLTRMRPAGESFGTIREPLSEAERAYLLPLFIEAQTLGNTERDKKRIAKAREELTSEHEKAVRLATIKRDGFLWLMDHGVKTDNVIFYSHTGRFGFGWRKKMGGAVLSRVLDLISEFPYPYDIETEDGRKLSGD